MLSQLQDIVISAYFYWLFVGPESDWVEVDALHTDMELFIAVEHNWTEWHFYAIFLMQL